MSTKRIQRTAGAGWRMPEGAVYVGRPTKWGNPYVEQAVVASPALLFVKSWVTGKAHAVELYERWIAGDVGVPLSGWNRHRTAPTHEEIRAELAGHDLACWCPLDQPCHADVLLRIAGGQS